MMTPGEVLAAAANMVEPEGAWTRGAWARDSSGRSQSPTSTSAVCWCMGGAIRAVAAAASEDDNAWSALVRAAQGSLHATVGRRNYGDWNDTRRRTQPEVVAALRAAAVLADQAAS